MTDIERYKLAFDALELCEYGPWVRYEDYAAALTECRAEKDRAAVTATLRAVGDAGTMKRLAAQSTAAREALAIIGARTCERSTTPAYQCAQSADDWGGYCMPCLARAALADSHAGRDK